MGEVLERDSDSQNKANFLPFHMYYLTEEMKVKAFTELHESDETRDKHIQEFRALLRGEEDLVFQDDDDFLLRFLRAKKFDVKQAFALCKHYYKSIMHHYLLTVTDEALEKAVRDGWAGILPYRNTDGSVLVYLTLDKFDECGISPEEVVQCVLTAAWRWLGDPANQICGCTFILNCKGLTIGHFITHHKVAFLFAEVMLRCFPARYKGFHFVHQSSLVSYFWFLLKYLTTKKIQSRVHIHGDNFEELHKFVPPEILPEECGGHLGPFQMRWTVEEKERTTKPYGLKGSPYGYKKRKQTFLTSLLRKAAPCP